MTVIKILTDRYGNVRIFNPLQMAADSTDENPLTEDVTYTNASVLVDGYYVQIINATSGLPLRQFVGGAESFFDIEAVPQV